jgi:hypothetical protein
VTGYNVFCSGLAHLMNGNVFVAGGNRELQGIVQTHLFEVDHPCVLARVAPAGDEHLANVEQRVAAVVSVQRVALAEALPCTVAVGVEDAHRLIRAGVEGPAVGRLVDPRIQRQVQRRRGQRPQRPVRRVSATRA